MLTADLALSYRRGRSISPRYVDPNAAAYVRVAEDLAAIVDRHLGRPRHELEAALDEYIGAGTDYKVLRGLIKLLSDRCVFVTAGRVEPTEIRRALFTAARAAHPVVTDEARERVVAEAAAALGLSAEEVAEHLYGDLSENERLADFEAIGARELLDLYNLAQAQALLYRAVAMELRVLPQEPAGYRMIFSAIKAYGLIHAISGSAREGYEVRLDGPVSIFHRSQKYGIQMAVFLPALLACEGWRMRAEVDAKRGGTAFFELESTQTRLRSTAIAPSRDMGPALRKFLEVWAAKGYGTAEESREVIDLGGGAFIPDALVRAETGEEAYLEVLGFWTPRYLEERVAELERAGFTGYVLAASEELLASRDVPKDVSGRVVIFKSSLDPKAVMRAIHE